ncbi:WhiB family transcriptional regulator [Mycolicibacterium wolinskyi]|uniref:4Fe-4S Wbl-type domain-containing protein n=1 Tax=Mycolicibacterium wolinskyi TaxID=59750 RepID=A0A1X2FJB3_9MYCO|nr:MULTISPECIES: WhiB family transcriptional regulator [Mycolicibacterium]MCV7286102.1 WhiB family transcriptional regulator [Mycolicibacterium wolinskyi]MCV7296298.1 WhiB family transcriptional regulator [Mycolicibacterium goodii]ORX18523.1 hypothetical protein AWC31_14585 [Mycolicibacterium wolinskyi]
MTECLPLTAAGSAEESWTERMLCRLYDPELWHAPELLEEGRAICGQCPAIKDCAANTLRLAANSSERLSGMWAGVDIPEATKGSAYRNRLKRLKHVAATGTQLPTRNRRSRVAV